MLLISQFLHHDNTIDVEIRQPEIIRLRDTLNDCQYTILRKHFCHKILPMRFRIKVIRGVNQTIDDCVQIVPGNACTIRLLQVDTKTA